MTGRRFAEVGQVMSSEMSSSVLSPDHHREVKQRITRKLSSSLRALQIRYVATDDVITSDDDDANALCVALEAVLIHGLKAKCIKLQTERRRRSNKGPHMPFPQPAFWALLKGVTHWNVISQLENISYIGTDVGRCRSWLRLALNECLLECYFLTLQRERSRLQEYYQPFSLMLDPEDYDVVLSYLQGLSSLSFHLSYKSSILNEWTLSPLSLAGLWLEDPQHVLPSHRRKSLDSVSQSSSSDDANLSMIGQRKAESPALSLDTGSSSSSLESDDQSRSSAAPILVQSCSRDPEELSTSPAEDMDTGISSASDTTAPSSPPSPLILDPPSSECVVSDGSKPEGSVTDAKDTGHVMVDTPPPQSSAPECEGDTATLPGSPVEPPKSWISEEDFTPADPIVAEDNVQPGNCVPGRPFHVVHRRQIGLSNPFRGLLMLGSLDRRTPLGLYKSYYCELTPYELRLQPEGEEHSCAETYSLLRCESVGAVLPDGRFDLLFHNKRLCLRAASRDEAQDWAERITEAAQKFRPTRDESWEVLHAPPLDWNCPWEAEPGALKEAVLYMRIQKKWMRFVFSLTTGEIKCFLPSPEKALYSCHSMRTVKDILPDSSLGGPACFRLVTTGGPLRLQAENPQEAKAWRELVRSTCLDSEEEPPLLPNILPIKPPIAHHTLYPYLLHIPTDKGMDTQNFKCAGCHKQIGFQFGKGKLCAFSALYYCELCHRDDRALIPSRIVHNWDMTERAVSRQAVKFLEMAQGEPLFNVKALNDGLYRHSEVMEGMRHERRKLRLLGEYLRTCRSAALEELSARLDHRRYLLECCHTYSLRDLQQISDGLFAPFLQDVVDFASRHVFQCQLCSQRGFICQICNHGDIIYPFQLETTSRCAECKAVFHIPCQAREPQCPRCLRRRRYQDEDGML